MNAFDPPETPGKIGPFEVRPLAREDAVPFARGVGRREMWSLFFPFLFCYDAPTRRILVAEAEGAMLLFLLRRGRGRQRVDLFYPPLGGAPERLPETFLAMLDAANEANGDRRARVLWADTGDVERARDLGLSPHAPEREYLYDLSEVAAMRGGRFRDVRKRFFRFLREFPLAHYRPMTDADLGGCRRLVRALERKQRRARIPVLDTGYTLTALKRHALFPPPDLLARVAVVGERIIGFAMAGRMNDELANFFILKSDHTVRGAAEFLRCRMMDELYSLGYTWVNDAGDLGKPGLRRHKEKFRPARTIEVCRLIQTPPRGDGPMPHGGWTSR